MCVFVSELTWEAEMIGISAKKVSSGFYVSSQ